MCISFPLKSQAICHALLLQSYKNIFFLMYSEVLFIHQIYYRLPWNACSSVPPPCFYGTRWDLPGLCFLLEIFNPLFKAIPKEFYFLFLFSFQDPCFKSLIMMCAHSVSLPHVTHHTQLEVGLWVLQQARLCRLTLRGYEAQLQPWQSSWSDGEDKMHIQKTIENQVFQLSASRGKMVSVLNDFLKRITKDKVLSGSNLSG